MQIYFRFHITDAKSHLVLDKFDSKPSKFRIKKDYFVKFSRKHKKGIFLVGTLLKCCLRNMCFWYSPKNNNNYYYNNNNNYDNNNNYNDYDNKHNDDKNTSCSICSRQYCWLQNRTKFGYCCLSDQRHNCHFNRSWIGGSKTKASVHVSMLIYFCFISRSYLYLIYTVYLIQDLKPVLGKLRRNVNFAKN